MPVLDADYLEFEKEDFQRCVLVKNVGWHPVEIKSYEKKRTKAGDADLHVYILEGLDDDAGRKGTALRFQVSSKAPKQFHASLVRALDPEASRTPGYKYNPHNAVGKKVEAFINHRMMDEDDPDSLINNVKDFRPIKG